ncbi:hypothetical protein PsorP6_015941 [Peronosclerospora sorghi]|uniref:Uncharacterized protein n=1 Tax=Peronosclerospora sorghi TaxID=230839 RepID=A0ACC0WMS8_9STRA|nr:hypothetical protein PsorP6_015941 [Peronosclerospora sorghi]
MTKKEAVGQAAEIQHRAQQRREQQQLAADHLCALHLNVYATKAQPDGNILSYMVVELNISHLRSRKRNTTGKLIHPLLCLKRI